MRSPFRDPSRIVIQVFVLAFVCLIQLQIAVLQNQRSLDGHRAKLIMIIFYLLFTNIAKIGWTNYIVTLLFNESASYTFD